MIYDITLCRILCTKIIVQILIVVRAASPICQEQVEENKSHTSHTMEHLDKLLVLELQEYVQYTRHIKNLYCCTYVLLFFLFLLLLIFCELFTKHTIIKIIKYIPTYICSVLSRMYM